MKMFLSTVDVQMANSSHLLILISTSAFPLTENVAMLVNIYICHIRNINTVGIFFHVDRLQLKLSKRIKQELRSIANGR